MSLRVSQFLERLRMDAIQKYISGDILDVGCGYGSVLKSFSPASENYVGIDHNPAVIQWLQKHYPDYQFLLQDADIESISVQRQFDTILMIAVLEHLQYPERLIATLPEFLKPDGKIVLTTPAPVGGWVHNLGGQLGIFSREAKEDHKGFYDHDSLVRLFLKAGLTIIEYRSFMVGMNQVAIFKRIQ